MSKIFLVLLAVTCFAVTVEADVFRQTEDYVISLELNADVREDILRNIRNYLPFSYSGKLLSRTHLKTFEEIVNTGLFEEVDGENIGKVAAISITALFNGAPAETIADIALIAFSKPLTESQMTTGAKALKNMSDAGISEDIQQQVVSYGFYNDWSNRNIRGISNGMIEGKRQSIPLEKLALALILRIDQGTVGVSFENTVDEEIGFIRNLRSSDPERMRRESIYRSMQSAAEKGLPEGIANDFYYNAVDEGWSAEDAQKLFDALVDGFRQGMTPEKLALAFILRMEADAGKVPIEKIITDEKKYVASLQKDRMKLQKKQYQPPVSYQQRPSYELRLNIPLMQNTINSFIGTPYMWGGNSRWGVDCSGFTKSVYSEQGILLPRVSREQYQVGKKVDYQNLSFGDLIFFNKSGYGMITHVGIYVGNGRFAHSCCSKGVTISSLNKGYYKKRYTGAKRIAG